MIGTRYDFAMEKGKVSLPPTGDLKAERERQPVADRVDQVIDDAYHAVDFMLTKNRKQGERLGPGNYDMDPDPNKVVLLDAKIDPVNRKWLEDGRTTDAILTLESPEAKPGQDTMELVNNLTLARSDGFQLSVERIPATGFEMIRHRSVEGNNTTIVRDHERGTMAVLLDDHQPV